MHTRLIPVGEVADYSSVARDLTPALALPENADIDREFPRTIARLGTTHQGAVEDLQKTAERCEVGVHEVFVAYVGSTAVGLSWITAKGTPPVSIEDPSSPNISGFIVNPWRNSGYGREFSVGILKIVNQNFGGRAWTLIDKSNDASAALARSVGFELMPKDSSIADRRYNLFTWSSGSAL